MDKKEPLKKRISDAWYDISCKISVNKILIIKIISNVMASLMFALGLVFLVPAVSPKLSIWYFAGENRSEDAEEYRYDAKIVIYPKTKYRIESIELTAEYYNKPVGEKGAKKIATEIIGTYNCSRTDHELYVKWKGKESVSRDNIKIKVTKVVTNNSADLARGIIFLSISAISLGILLYLVLSPKYR